MFGKLKSVFAKFKKDVSKKEKIKPEVKPKIVKPTTKPTEEKRNEPVKKEGLFKKLFKKKPKEEAKPEVKKPGFFAKLTEVKTDKVLENLEEALIQNNVSYSVTEKICLELRTAMKAGKKDVKKELEQILSELLSQEQPDLLKLTKENKPLVIMFVGVNGVGKTTTIAKLTKWFQNQKKSVVLAAADTFRAAAIEQLEVHAKKLKVHMIKHKYGADPAAVAFDARKHAEAKKVEVVIIDTAGRQHASDDLMAELQKIKLGVKPDFTILSVDSLTGNDASEQAKYFSEKIGIDGIIISKVDADERGGAVISASWVAKKPILFLGTGQTYKDLKKFNADEIIKKIL